jgi:5'-nucleotidase
VHHSQWRRIGRTLAVPVLIVATVALTPLAGSSGSATISQLAWTPMSPVSLNFDDEEHDETVTGSLLAFNDFHGNIDPPTGSGGLVNGVPSGGAEYLAFYVKKLRAEQALVSDKVITVAAGDNVGASPLVSAAFHDEPAVEILNSLALDLSSVGNHEFDEGVTELRRLQFGGCHPVDGCQDGDGFAGAKFPFLAANVTDKQTKLPILLPFWIEFVKGVPVAFVGMTLEGTPTIVNPAGITTVDFRDEVATANFYAKLLGFLGIRSLVLVVHEGGAQNPLSSDPSNCASFAGVITPIVAGLHPNYGVVVSGHTHQWYSCALPNSSGANSVVTSAGSAGRLVTTINMTIDRKTRKFVSASAQNVIADNGVKNPDGSYQIGPGGVPVRDPAKVDPQAKVIADKYRTAVAPLANQVIGSITQNIVRAAGPNGESPLGDVIADAQLAYTAASAGAQIALMNPGGIRADLSFGSSAGGEAPGQVTFGEAFTVQPFNNLVVTQTYTGAQLKVVLEQQFLGGGTPPRTPQQPQVILQISAGFSFTYDLTRAPNDKITAMSLNGVAIDPAASYRVTTNDFLANGGDQFVALTVGTNRVTAPGFDVDALVAYLGGATAPIGPGPANRIIKAG